MSYGLIALGLFGRLRMYGYAVDLGKLLFDAVFQRGGHVVDRSD